jgi:hypothetical protein
VGTTGAASASGTSGILFAGKLSAVYIDTIATTAGTFLRINQGDSPGLPYLSVSATADAWYFPRNGLVDSAGAATAGVDLFPVTGRLAFAVGTSVPGVHTAYIYVEEA